MDRRRAVALGAVLLMLAGAAGSQATPSKPAPGQDVLELQKDVLETTRKTAESAIEQTRKMAEQAIQAADRSNQMLQTVFGWSVIVLGVLVAFGAFVGWNELRDLRKAYARRFKAAVDAELDTFRTRSQAVTLMSIDIAQVVDEMSKLGDGDKSRLGPARGYIEEVRKRAEELKHDRTVGWAWAQRALVCYYAGDYEEAFRAQKQASEPRFNPMEWPDRSYNLACFAAKIYAKDSTRVEMRLLCVDVLQKLCASPQQEARQQAKGALTDEDLKAILALEPELEALIRRTAA